MLTVQNPHCVTYTVGGLQLDRLLLAEPTASFLSIHSKPNQKAGLSAGFLNLGAFSSLSGPSHSSPSAFFLTNL